MKIKFLAHAAFKIETNGLRIVMDPYGAHLRGTLLGYDPINEEADVVTSCDLYDDAHNGISNGIRGSFRVLCGLDVAQQARTVGGITFRAIQTFELDDRQERNAIIHFESEGIRVCHMGDAGVPLTDDEVGPIVGVDVMLARANAVRGMNLDAMKHIIDRTGPKVVIPMHYATSKAPAYGTLEEFLAYFPATACMRGESPEVELTRDSLPTQLTVLVLPHSR